MPSLKDIHPDIVDAMCVIHGLMSFGFDPEKLALAPGKPPHTEHALWVVVNSGEDNAVSLRVADLPVAPGEFMAAAEVAFRTWRDTPWEEVKVVFEQSRMFTTPMSFIRPLIENGLLPPHTVIVQHQPPPPDETN